MAFLSPSVLRKYEWRSEVFVNKLKTGAPFQTASGQVTLTFSPEIEQIVNEGSLRDLKALRIDGYKLTDLVKCADFGGKSDNGTVKEQFALNRFNEVLNGVKTLIGKPYVPVRVGDQLVEVTKAIDTPGTPKSDFHLVTGDGQEVFWISHKDGKTAKCFQQWGGVSARSELRVNQHEETQTFISKVKKSFPNGVPKSTTVVMKISCDSLKSLSVYGNEFGGNFSRQNVNVVIQGNVGVDCNKQEFSVTGDIIHQNGQLIAGGYEPIFIATLRNDRSNEGIPNTRLSIAPIDGRKITTWL